MTAVVCIDSSNSSIECSRGIGLPRAAAIALRCLCLGAVLSFAGCGTTKSQTGTEQLLASNAVDLSIAQIDFTELADQKVYLDTTYLKNIKGIGFVNADYIISALRQQLASSKCLLQDNRDDADFIVEARVGALGGDHHDVTYGLPASNLLSTAASIMPSMPSVPSIPELSIAKKSDQSAAAKIAVFAYHRETKEPVWQSGIAQARATAKDVWIAGAGPFQSGTIHDGPRFAGGDVLLPFEEEYRPLPSESVDYQQEHRFADVVEINERAARTAAQAVAAAEKPAAADGQDSQSGEAAAAESGVQQADHTADHTDEDPPLPQLLPVPEPELFPEPDLGRFLSEDLQLQTPAQRPWLQLETDPASTGAGIVPQDDAMKFQWSGSPLLEPAIEPLAPAVR